MMHWMSNIDTLVDGLEMTPQKVQMFSMHSVPLASHLPIYAPNICLHLFPFSRIVMLLEPQFDSHCLKTVLRAHCSSRVMVLLPIVDVDREKGHVEKRLVQNKSILCP